MHLSIVLVSLITCSEGCTTRSTADDTTTNARDGGARSSLEAPDANDARQADGSNDAPRDAANSGCEAGSLRGLAALARDAADRCQPWLERVRGRVCRAGMSSGAVWTTRTASGLALVTGAAHTLGTGALASDGSNVPERIEVPEDSGGGLRLVLPREDGSTQVRAVAFPLFNPSIPAVENTSPFAKLRPRHDFYVDVMDVQRYPVDEPGEPLPDPITRGVVPLHDPDGMAAAAPTFGNPGPGEIVLYAGFPTAGPFAEDGAVGFGRVLSTADANAALATLQAAGDEEGVIAYDAEAEMIIEGEAASGMSGGGVFDRAGRLAGILVRASTSGAANKYVRAVRISFVASALAAAHARAPLEKKSGALPYMPKP